MGGIDQPVCDVAIVACFSENIYIRPYMVARYFDEAGLRPLILTMGFSHVHKRPLGSPEPGVIHVPVPPYHRNISLKRIFSHLVFSLRAGRQLRAIGPKIIYVCCPPNASAYAAYRAAKAIGAKLIVDVLDVWPEAMPFPAKLKAILNATVFPFWRRLRDTAIRRADYALCESALFLDKMGPAGARCQVVYLSHDRKPLDLTHIQVPEQDTLRIVYLGNISHIGDFDSLVSICAEIKRYRVHVDIIGDGERREYLLDQLERRGIAYTYHGVVYDEGIKQPILAASDFGFNGYKDQTAVALSYKSIEYFSKAVPLINSAKPDTWDIVARAQAGVNFCASAPEAAAQAIDALDREALYAMRVSARAVFEQWFAFEPYRQKMDEVLLGLQQSAQKGHKHTYEQA